MNDKIGKMGSAWVWLFALGAVLFGMGSGYVTAGMSAKISSGVYFGVFIVSGFAAMALTQAKAWLGIAAFLLAALVSAAGYYWIAAQAGLTDEGGWCPIRPAMMQSAMDESVQILRGLLPYVTGPEFTVKWSWRPGDVVVWDNRCTIHAATWFDAQKHSRIMWRATVCRVKSVPATLMSKVRV